MPVKTKEHQPNEVLSLRDSAKNQLEQIKTVEQGITYFNKLKSIEVWVQAEKKDAELQNLIAEQKLRTQRLLGELIEESQRKGILATQSHNGGGIQSGLPESQTRKNVSEYGLTYKQTSNFKAIAGIPEEKFEEFISERKQAVADAVAELTTAGALRLAKSLVHEETNHEPQSPVKFKEDSTPEEEVKEMATWINNNFSKEQKAMLITLIYPN